MAYSLSMASETQSFEKRHFHIADWNTRVVFKCVEATLIEAGKERGRVVWIKSGRDKCAMRRKLES